MTYAAENVCSGEKICDGGCDHSVLMTCAAERQGSAKTFCNAKIEDFVSSVYAVVDDRFGNSGYFVCELRMRPRFSSNVHPDSLLGQSLIDAQQRLLEIWYQELFAS
jgi:hypothetical protein